MEKIKNKSCSSLCIVIIILLSATVTGAISIKNDFKSMNNDLEDPLPSKTWTVMIYFAGDHHRGKEIPYIQDILSDIGSTDEVNFVCLSDGKDDGDTLYCYIEKDLILPLDWYEYESNMADPDTFEKFLELTTYTYPAEKYALFTLSAWGSGWQGVFSDTHGTGSGKTLDLITMPEIGQVLKEITNDGSDKLDFYGIDVCVPGMVEVASEIAPYVDYMVANQEHGFGGPDGLSDDGQPLEWNYTNFLQQLVDNPSMTPEEFATSLVDSYNPGTYTEKIFGTIKPPKWYPIIKFHTDLSATDLGEIGIVESAIDTLGTVLKDNLNECKKEIKEARSKTREYGKLYRKFWFFPAKLHYALYFDPLGYDCFIDVYDFADKLSIETTNQDVKNACEQVKNAINTTVIANEAVEYDSTHGLSIYFPQLRYLYDKSIWRGMNKNFWKISSYTELRFSDNTNWDEFLKSYLF